MKSHFSCPHCQTVFPALASMVERRVRCSSCRQGFILHRDGQARPLAMPSESASRPLAARRRQPTDEELLLTTNSWVDQSQTRREVRSTLRRTMGVTDEPERITDRHKALRSRMQQAAEAAVHSIPATETAAQQSARRPEAVTIVRTHHERHGHRVRWLSIMALVLVAFGYLILRPVDELELALDRYARSESGLSLEQRRQRAWLVTADGEREVLALADVGTVTTLVRERIRLDVVQDVFLADLRELRPFDTAGAFVDERYRERFDALRREGIDPRGCREKLADEDLRQFPYEVLHDRLAASGLPELGQEIVALVLAGEASDPDGNPLRVRWLDGEMPVAVDVAALRGEDALALYDNGRNQTVRPVAAYRVVLVQFIGTGWERRWRVLDCRDLNAPAPYEPPLQARARRRF